jgi:DNA-directed RNA polymerase subunit F
MLVGTATLLKRIYSMNNENRITLLVLSVVIIGIFIGLMEATKISAEIKILYADNKEISSEIKDLTTSIKEVKTILAEKDTEAFRRDMQENGRRMLSMDYAGKFARWDAVKMEVDELNKTLENAANQRPDLAQTIMDFRITYIPKLKDAADTKDTKNFEAMWSDTYNACIACHKDSTALS